MELQSESFDAVAYEVEAHLRALRHLVAETVFMSDAQNAALNSLKESLHNAELQASALRQSLLTGAEPLSIEALQEERGSNKKATDELAALEARLRIENPTYRDLPRDDFEGGSGVTAVPKRPVPVMAGGAAKTFEEAEEPPRNP